MKMRSLLLAALITAAIFPQEMPKKFTDILKSRFTTVKESDEILAWVFFTDKGADAAKWARNPEAYLTKRSLERRAMRALTEQAVDETDYPIASSYAASLEAAGVKIRHRSNWLNGISISATKAQLLQISRLPFVKELDIVYQMKKERQVKDDAANAAQEMQLQPKGVYAYDYGQSFTQNNQIKVPDVHNLGILGAGVMVCVQDAGFNNLPHQAFAQMQIYKTYDFVNHRIGVNDSTGLMGEGSHGTQTLSTVGGFYPGQLIGPAFKAKYILAKTENTDSETPIEEDNWIAAAQWADSLGADIITSSLGYTTFDPPFTSYTWQNMDGEFCRITRGADLAVLKGIVVLNSAGNDGLNTSHNTLGAPADGKRVIAVGAVTSSGTRSSFSSVGNTVDGRVKPDVMAMGSSVRVASAYSTTGYTSASGTSFSCPLSAGVAALVLSARPYLNPIQVRDAMRNTASRAATPGREYGWGILNALNAVNYFPASNPPQLLSPANNAVVPSTGTLLRWSKVATATQYRVQVSTSSSFDVFTVNDSSVTDTVFTLPPLSAGTIYYWRVSAKSNNIYSVYATTFMLKTSSVSLTWQNGIVVGDAGSQQQLFFGTSPSATNAVDPLLNELSLPPVPPAGVFDARFALPVTPPDYSVRDYRSDTNKTITWLLQFQPSGAGYPVRVQWDSASLGQGTFILKDAVTGTIINVNMKSVSKVDITNSGIAQLKIEYTKQACANVALVSGWNLLSVPLLASDMSAQSLFPQASSQIYGYANGYVTAATLETGKGYWGRFPAQMNAQVCGLAPGMTVPLNAGWNIIGVYDRNIAASGITTLPAGIITSQFYGFSNGYVNAPALESGKGYWVRASQAGVMQLPAALAAAKENPIADIQATTELRVADAAGSAQTLRFASVSSNQEIFELPPLPPAGVFDARFDNGSSLLSGGAHGRVLIAGAEFPIAIQATGQTVNIRDAATNGKLLHISLRDGESCSIENPAISAIEVEQTAAPLAFALSQNYPNPFNPVTTISYALPNDGIATLKVFDILGKEVQTLLNEAKSAGSYSVSFNASAVPSGTYFYELRAGEFRAVRKMIILR